MSTNVEIIRAFDGALHLAVGGQYAVGARVSGINVIDGELAAVVIVPMKHVTISERDNIVPFERNTSL